MSNILYIICRFRRHKDGCLCAVCVLKRRRLEKEGKDLPQNVDDLIKTNDKNMAIGSKQEVFIQNIFLVNLAQ